MSAAEAAMNGVLLRIAQDLADRPATAAAICDGIRQVAAGMADAMRPPVNRVEAMGAALGVANQAKIARDEYQRRPGGLVPAAPVDLALCGLAEA